MQACKVVVLMLAFLAAATGAAAQGADAGSLRGVVTDGTGAALPGVTITAASSAVMGGSLTAVSSAEGLYRFPSLPPGVYTLRFALQGFKAAEIPDLRINVGLGLTIDHRMEVAAVEESLTVVGAAPIVDTRNTSGEIAWTRELMQKIPSSRDLWSTMQQVPGLVMGKENVGGIESPFLSTFSVHGSVRGSHQYNMNGVDISDMHSGIAIGYVNTDSFEEIQFTTSGVSAENSRGGLVMNQVHKSGSNRFSGMFATYFSNDALQGSNVDDELRARGVTGSGANLDYLRDFSANLGGPIVEDAIWFFLAGRVYDVVPFVINCTLPNGEQCQDGVNLPGHTAKITAQAGPSNRFLGVYDRGYIYRRNRGVSQFTPLDAAANESFHWDLWQGKYDRIISSSMLLQAGVSRGSPPFRLGYHSTARPGVPTAFDEITRTRFDRAVQDFFQQGDILIYNGNLTYFRNSWLGGSHDFKVGAEHRRGKLVQRTQRLADLERRYLSGAPYRVLVFNTPVEQVARNYGTSVFGQDSMRVGRATLNLGLRLESWNGDVPEQSNQPGTFAAIFGGGQTFPEQQNVMAWTTLSPRLGIAYDVAGDSKTVLKATYNRYFFQIRSGDLNSFSNPNALAQATYNWSDLNRDDFPDYPGEFGTLVSLNLPALRSIDPNLESPFTDEFTASAEQAFGPAISVSARYTYRKTNKLTATDDLALPNDAFSIPSTAIDPLTGQTINYWSLGPAFASVRNQEILTQFDNNYSRYHGVDFTFNRRFDGRWLLVGSVTLQDNYGRVGGYLNRNDDEIFPSGQVGLDARYLTKIVGTYRLPYDVGLSVFFRSTGGMNSNNAENPGMARIVQVADVTTRSLYGVRVEENGEFRQEATNILDLRLAKTFRLKATRLEVLVDGFNLTNANNVLATGVITGSDLNVPLRIVSPRVFRLGAKFDF